VEGVDITPSDELSVDRDEDKYKRNGKWYYDYNSFIGTYEAGTEIPESALFLSGNKFWYSVGKTTTKAFRGYFSFYMVLSDISTAETRISLWLDGDETTGIKGIGQLDNLQSDDWYDLFGRKIVNGQSSARPNGTLDTSRNRQMKMGIYVKDGKKVIIK
jgi:hypothetical protein